MWCSVGSGLSKTATGRELDGVVVAADEGHADLGQDLAHTLVDDRATLQVRANGRHQLLL